MDLKLNYSFRLLFYYFRILNYILIFEIQQSFLKSTLKNNSISVTKFKEHVPSHSGSISYYILGCHGFLAHEDKTLLYQII